MSRAPMHLEGRLLRASPEYELVLVDRLPPEERATLAELEADASFYGVVRPIAEDGRSVRAVDRDTALLLLTLRQPGPLPSYVLRTLAGRADPGLLGLIMDGVLEVAEGERFLSGAAAAALLFPTGDARTTAAEHADGRSRLARLSAEALAWAAALPVRERNALAARLYGFGRLPVSPAWARRLPDVRAVLRFLGAERGELQGFVARTSGRPGDWIQWTRTASRAPRPERPGSRHKLYVSPTPEALPEALARTVACLRRTPARQFKVGGDAAGVLRPDCMVVYFDDAGALAATGQELAERLAGLPARGVPFTADLDRDGLLSWGVDPPPNQRPVSWLPTESWRWWVVRQLAAALVEARRAGPTEAVALARFALERLRLEGVDVERWIPAAWSHAGV